jgi:hypothetical protein
LKIIRQLSRNCKNSFGIDGNGSGCREWRIAGIDR